MAHKKSQGAKHYDEDDDILRAPVALAMVKLLLKLPTTLLDQHLPGFALFTVIYYSSYILMKQHCAIITY